MMEIFLRIRDELIEVSNDGRSDITVNASIAFRDRATKYTGWLKRINNCTQFLQTRLLSLEKCRGVLDILIDDVQTFGEEEESPLYNCNLGVKYIASDHCQ